MCCASRLVLCGLAAMLTAAAGTQADVVWDESVNGDLSGNRFSPTPLTLAVGANTVIASTHQGSITP